MNLIEPRVLSVVVIGLNEESRLGASIDAVFATCPLGIELDVIYVDSGSTDRSVEIAERCGARVLHLIDAQRSAARARNLGLKHARGRIVQLIDGDSIVQPGWFDAALKVIGTNPGVACVFGQCIEMDPAQSIYMRVCALNWHVPAGERRYCGGNALWRRDVIEAEGYFDETLSFGEEPDLCYRVRQQGAKIVCLDTAMVTHDLAMVRFTQYWRRARNSGDAYARIAMRYWRKSEKLWLRETVLNLLEPATWILVATLGWLKSGYAGATGLLLVWWLLRASHIAVTLRNRSVRTADKLLYGFHCQFVRVPAAMGQIAVFLSSK